jgi:Icc-related predicted phosphoesterase
MKKLILVSDIHEDLESLAKAVDYAQAKEADHILCAGDFSLMPFKKEHILALQQTQDLEAFVKAKREYNSGRINEIKAIFDGSGIPYNVVPGNYDPELSDIFAEHDLHKKTAQLGNAKIFGYGGADAFPDHILSMVELGEIVDFDPEELYNLLNRENPDIVLSHIPPRGACDTIHDGERGGTIATTKYVMENMAAGKNPKLIVAGHIHESGPYANNPKNVKGVMSVPNPDGHRTVVVNPGNIGRFMQFDFGTFVEMDIEEDGKPLLIVQYSIQGDDKKIIDPKQIGEYDFRDVA